MRTTISGIIAAILVGGIIFIGIQSNSSADSSMSTSTPFMGGTTSAPHETINPNAAGATYTLAQVATHSTRTDCWTTINGGVYNVTSWIDQHPGGAEAILSLCGKDGSGAFNGQHGGQARPASELAGFRVGTLSK